MKPSQVLLQQASELGLPGILFFMLSVRVTVENITNCIAMDFTATFLYFLNAKYISEYAPT